MFAASSMAILGATTLPLAVKAHYIAVSRVWDRLNRCAAVITVGGVLSCYWPLAVLPLLV